MIAQPEIRSSHDKILSVVGAFRKLCTDEYAEVTSPMYASAPISSDRNFDFNVVQWWRTEHCVFAEAACNAFVGFRTRREIQNAGHILSVYRFISGKEQGELNGKVIERLPGPLYVDDQALPCRTITSQMHVQQVFIPKEILNLPESVIQKQICIRAGTPSGMLLHTCFDQVFDTLKTDPNKMRLSMTDRFLALLKANIGVHPEREDVRSQYRQFLLEQIICDIEKNLSDPGFSTSTILRRFGVSRASLYRMFEPYGGVRSYITQRRVTRAVLDLEARQNVRGFIRDAAERWGFSSRPNFNRTIRAAYGTSPGKLFNHVDANVRSALKQGSVLADLAAGTALAA